MGKSHFEVKELVPTMDLRSFWPPWSYYLKFYFHCKMSLRLPTTNKNPPDSTSQQIWGLCLCWLQTTGLVWWWLVSILLPHMPILHLYPYWWKLGVMSSSLEPVDLCSSSCCQSPQFNCTSESQEVSLGAHHFDLRLPTFFFASVHS